MNYILFIIIFVIILFLYLHIWYHIKTGNYLEVYHLENYSKEKLEEICNIRHPVVFNYDNDELKNVFNMDNLNENYGIFDIKIRNLNNDDDNSEIYLPFTFNEAVNVFNKDKDSKYIIENNQEFLDETTLIKTLKYNDEYLRPPLLFNSKYDMLSGSIDATTPLRYNLSYRNYFYVSDGDIDLKLIPPKFTKYLYPKNDYVNFEFSSPMNFWNIQDKFRKNYNKVKVLDIKLKKGETIYIPAYWWYSIHFKEKSIICNFKYKTLMNIISIIPQLFMKFLQQQNIKMNSFNIKDKLDNIIEKQ